MNTFAGTGSLINNWFSLTVTSIKQFALTSIFHTHEKLVIIESNSYTLNG